MLHIPLTNLRLLAAKQEPYKTKTTISQIVLQKVQQNGPVGRKKKEKKRQKE